KIEPSQHHLVPRPVPPDELLEEKLGRHEDGDEEATAENLPGRRFGPCREVERWLIGRRRLPLRFECKARPLQHSKVSCRDASMPRPAPASALGGTSAIVDP